MYYRWYKYPIFILVLCLLHIGFHVCKTEGGLLRAAAARIPLRRDPRQPHPEGRPGRHADRRATLGASGRHPGLRNVKMQGWCKDGARLMHRWCKDDPCQGGGRRAEV